MKKKRQIALTIIATDNHCNNNCPGMNSSADYCYCFEADLHWDPKKTLNGNKRLLECVRAELTNLGEEGK